MTKEDYKKLNDYLNETFKYLEKHYDPLLWKLYSICRVNDKYYGVLSSYDLKDSSIENNLTYMDVIKIAREIINSINTKYLPDFDNLLNSGQLDFSYKNEYYDSCFIHNNNYNLININRSFNYNDVIILIHEYFHFTNGKENCSFNRNLLTEFFSIYFETYAIDYLLKSEINKNEIDYKARLRWNYSICSLFVDYEIPFMAYYYLGNINDESYEMIISHFLSDDYKEELFDKECRLLLEFFEQIEKKYKYETFKNDYNDDDIRYNYCNLFIDCFKYVLGTLLSFYARDNCKLEDIIYMNDHINDEDKDFYDCLRIMGIDVKDKDLEDKMLDSIKKYLNTYQIKKVKNV